MLNNYFEINRTSTEVFELNSKNKRSINIIYPINDNLSQSNGNKTDCKWCNITKVNRYIFYTYIMCHSIIYIEVSTEYTENAQFLQINHKQYLHIQWKWWNQTLCTVIAVDLLEILVQIKMSVQMANVTEYVTYRILLKKVNH